MVSPTGDTCEALVFIFGIDLALNLGVGELVAVVGGGISVTFDVEGVGAFDTL